MNIKIEHSWIYPYEQTLSREAKKFTSFASNSEFAEFKRIDVSPEDIVSLAEKIHEVMLQLEVIYLDPKNAYFQSPARSLFPRVAGTTFLHTIFHGHSPTALADALDMVYKNCSYLFFSDAQTRHFAEYQINTLMRIRQWTRREAKEFSSYKWKFKDNIDKLLLPLIERVLCSPYLGVMLSHSPSLQIFLAHIQKILFRNLEALNIQTFLLTAQHKQQTGIIDELRHNQDELKQTPKEGKERSAERIVLDNIATIISACDKDKEVDYQAMIQEIKNITQQSLTGKKEEKQSDTDKKITDSKDFFTVETRAEAERFKESYFTVAELKLISQQSEKVYRQITGKSFFSYRGAQSTAEQNRLKIATECKAFSATMVTPTPTEKQLILTASQQVHELISTILGAPDLGHLYLYYFPELQPLIKLVFIELLKQISDLSTKKHNLDLDINLDKKTITTLTATVTQLREQSQKPSISESDSRCLKEIRVITATPTKDSQKDMAIIRKSLSKYGLLGILASSTSSTSSSTSDSPGTTSTTPTFSTS